MLFSKNIPQACHHVASSLAYRIASQQADTNQSKTGWGGAGRGAKEHGQWRAGRRGSQLAGGCSRVALSRYHLR